MIGKLLGFGKDLVGDGGIIDQLVLDKDQALALKGAIMGKVIDASAASDARMGEAIVADAHGNWLQRSWRPIIALICGFALFMVTLALTAIAIGAQAGADMSPMISALNESEWFIRHVVLVCLIYLLGYGAARTGEKAVRMIVGRKSDS